MRFLTVAKKPAAKQNAMQLRPKKTNSQSTLLCLRQRFLETLIPGLAPSVFALLVVPTVLRGKNLRAQTLVSQVVTPAQQQQKATIKLAQPYQATAEAIPASPAPSSPANQTPNPAKVRWDSRGLEIEASNSSLNQILQRVAVDTGAKLEGLAQDQRVFGSYGPGSTSDVLLKLLDGSGYNVLILGGRGSDAPLEIVLSARLSASPQTAANNQNRRGAQPLEPEPQRAYSSEPPPQQIQNPFGNGEPPRDPKEFMQEILQRQQKIDQQQDQKNNPQQ